MKRAVFRWAAILLAAAVLLTAGAAVMILHPGPEDAEFFTREIPSALWVLPTLLIACLLGAYALACRITDPIQRIDPERPGQTVPYEELLPLMARLREQDRTIQRQTETLGRARRGFDAITENMSESFLLVDRRLNVVSRNVSAQYLLPAPEPGKPDNLMGGECPTEILRATERALTGTRTELTLPLHNRYYHIIATPVFSESQITGAVVVALDTTEKEERDALRREFSANVSHELKTPLTSIAGFAELLKDGMVEPERTAEFGGDIYREAQRMIALVDDIIELSRLEDESEPPVMETVDLFALAEETLETLRPAAEKVPVTLELKGESAPIQGVRAALQEMIGNLCDNAVKYNRPDGRVTVTTEKTEKGCTLSVEDTGIGIPYEHPNRVFERFYRVDKSHSRELGGTGLGLSIVKHAAQIHRARLELWSEPGVGTRITVHFPGKEQTEQGL